MRGRYTLTVYRHWLGVAALGLATVYTAQRLRPLFPNSSLLPTPKMVVDRFPRGQIGEKLRNLCLGENKLIGFTDIFYKKESQIRRPVQQSGGESSGSSDNEGQKYETIKITRYNCQARALAQFVGICLYAPDKVKDYFPSCTYLSELLPQEESPSLYEEEFGSCFDKFLREVYGSGTQQSGTQQQEDRA